MMMQPAIARAILDQRRRDLLRFAESSRRAPVTRPGAATMPLGARIGWLMVDIGLALVLRHGDVSADDRSGRWRGRFARLD